MCLQPDGLREAQEAEEDCGFSDGQLGRSTEYARPSIECRVACLRFIHRLLVKARSLAIPAVTVHAEESEEAAVCMWSSRRSSADLANFHSLRSVQAAQPC